MLVMFETEIFIMTWGLAHFYVSKANKYDKAAKEIIAEYEGGNAK